jgi:hypothetical protein
MKDVGIFYGHLVHFTVFSYILWSFGIVFRNLVYFPRFGILYHEKSGNPEGYRTRAKYLHTDLTQFFFCFKKGSDRNGCAQQRKSLETTLFFFPQFSDIFPFEGNYPTADIARKWIILLTFLMFRSRKQGCQMVCFSNQKSQFG